MRGREPYRVFIGYDPMESLAAEVAKESLLSTGTHPIAVTMLNQEKLRLAGLYGRTAFQQDTQCYDATDMRPFSICWEGDTESFPTVCVFPKMTQIKTIPLRGGLKGRDPPRRNVKGFIHF